MMAVPYVLDRTGMDWRLIVDRLAAIEGCELDDLISRIDRQAQAAYFVPARMKVDQAHLVRLARHTENGDKVGGNEDDGGKNQMTKNVQATWIPLTFLPLPPDRVFSRLLAAGALEIQHNIQPVRAAELNDPDPLLVQEYRGEVKVTVSVLWPDKLDHSPDDVLRHRGFSPFHRR